MARVSVTVSVRDLTRGELTRMRHNFRSLGDDLTNAVGNRSRQNFERLSQSVNVARRDLTRLRGIIPEAEFIRLDDAIRRSQRTMQRGFSNVGNRAFNRVAQQVREVVDGFRDLDQNSQIRIRVDHSALDRADALLERWRRDTSRQVTIRPDVDTNHMNQRIRRWAMGPLRGLGGLVGGILSDGLGQGLIGAFRSPLFGTAIVAAIVAALAFVGAALAGVLVLAIGGAFVGLGAMIAARSKEVTRNWEAEMKRLGPIFKDAAEPLVDVLHRATHILGDMGAEFAPKFKEALEKAAPHLDNFVDRTRDGLKKLGQGAWDSLQEAFRVFLDAFGPQWEDFLMELGKSLGALARTVTAHSEEMAMALRGVLGVINLLIDVVNFFANVWVMSVGIAQKGILGFFVVLQFIVEQIMGLFEMILAGATDAFSWVPGLGPQLEEAKAKFGTFRDSVNEKLQNMSDQARQWGVDMDNANKERVLRVDIASWQNQLARAKEELKSVPPEKKTELLGRINDLQNKISQANGALAAMQKDYYVRIHAYKVGDWAIGGGGPYAHGGVVGNHLGRAATGGARSNMTIVGEHGPELVNLPPGSHVRSNPDSRRMMGQQNGGGGATTLILKADGSRASNLILELLRDAIHDAGGDPVRVLGG